MGDTTDTCTGRLCPSRSSLFFAFLSEAYSSVGNHVTRSKHTHTVCMTIRTLSLLLSAARGGEMTPGRGLEEDDSTPEFL